MVAATVSADAVPTRDAPSFAQRRDDAIELARRAYGERCAPTGERVIDHALALSEILAGLQTDDNTQLAAILYGVGDGERSDAPLGDDALEARFGADVAAMVKGIVQLMRVTEIARGRDVTEGVDRKSADKVVTQQAEALRKMLLAMVGDLRVVLVRLASRLRTLRWYAQMKDAADARLRTEYARETLDLYAPLANRLGIWQLKWELEDLAFRFLEPAEYKRIAHALEERRVEREAFVAQAIERLHDELARAGIRADVSGRPKHIYSIRNKMRSKGVDFDALYDVRAFRVIVDDEKQCYTVLGIVHHLWQPIPKEFDDYISRPKGNGYQSLHTVVIGDDGKPFEVQIRTHDMHRFAEYGVAAHWRYKEAGNRSLAASGEYESKIAWIRQLFAWKSDVSKPDAAVESDLSDPNDPQGFDAVEWTERLKSASLDDRVYVLTPQARVVELPAGATPLDFAYHVHSDLGHRCRGAKVDGAMVPLNTPLRTGQTVEIIANKSPTAGPSRDWLGPGYLASTRSRAKVRAYFNALDLDASITQGRARIERELQRLGKTSVSFDELASKLGHGKPDELFVAAARDEFNMRQLDALFEAPAPVDVDDALHPARIGKGKADASRSGVLVVGMDKLMTQLARCCKPAPPDAVRGFVTRGKGVSIHRADCATFARLAAADPQRVIETQWGHAEEGALFPVDVSVRAVDRQGLLRDVSDVFARQKINVTGVKTQSRRGEARMLFTAEVPDAATLARALAVLHEVAGVFEVERR